MQAVQQLAPVAGVVTACRALRLSRATLYRRKRHPSAGPTVVKATAAGPAAPATAQVPATPAAAAYACDAGRAGDHAAADALSTAACREVQPVATPVEVMTVSTAPAGHEVPVTLALNSELPVSAATPIAALSAVGLDAARVEIPSTADAAVRVWPRALEPEERSAVLDALHSPRFVDKAPAEIYATLLDEGTYHCSVRTMYRILTAEHEVRERRNVLRHPNYRKPELLATGPNQVWSWDITKLRGPAKWILFSLYVMLDIYSRYVVGWLLEDCESDELARQLIAASCAKQGITPGQLTIHADRGGPMKAKTVAQLLSDLVITKTHSRPHVSDDNPFSEAQFKTLKYRPDFPDRFGSVQDGRAFCREFFPWYNDEHHHSGLGLLTPADVHYGRAEQILAARQATLSRAYMAHPERFRRPPRPSPLPSAVWINPPPRPRLRLEPDGEG